MCTSICPCNSNLNLTMWEESHLNDFNRTKGTNGTNGRVRYKYNPLLLLLIIIRNTYNPYYRQIFL